MGTKQQETYDTTSRKSPIMKWILVHPNWTSIVLTIWPQQAHIVSHPFTIFHIQFPHKVSPLPLLMEINLLWIFTPAAADQSIQKWTGFILLHNQTLIFNGYNLMRSKDLCTAKTYTYTSSANTEVSQEENRKILDLLFSIKSYTKITLFEFERVMFECMKRQHGCGLRIHSYIRYNYVMRIIISLITSSISASLSNPSGLDGLILVSSGCDCPLTEYNECNSIITA